MSIRTTCLALSLLLTGWYLPQARGQQAHALVPGYRTETNIPYRSGANLDGYVKECCRLDMELLGRYEENAYLWRMMKEVGHPGTELYELEGFNHGQMAEPAHPLLIQFVKRHRGP